MKHKNQMVLLNNAILLLEARRKKEYEDLRIQFYESSENFRPINIIKQTIKDFSEMSEVKTNLFETLISVTGGYFSKRLIIGKPNSFIKMVLGYVLQYSVTNFISKKVSSNTNE